MQSIDALKSSSSPDQTETNIQGAPANLV